MARYDREIAQRAARFAAFPGVRRHEACKRFRISAYALDKAFHELGASARPSARDLVLAGVTRYGEQREGEVPDLGTLASYIDYVEKNGATIAEVDGWLEDLVERGMLEIVGNRYRLVGQFP